MLIRSAIILIFLMITWSNAHAEIRYEQGDLRVYLAVNVIVRTDIGGYEIPEYQETVTFYESVQKLLQEDFSGAANDLDPLGYDVVRFEHTPTGEFYYLLEERFFLRAQGAYCFNPNGKRLLNIQVPHAVSDNGTRPESIAIFMETQAVFYQLSGSWRCINPTPSDCTGTTVTCSDDPEAYRVSDAAHYAGGFFQAASDAVHDEVPDLVSISVHGFGCGTQEEAQESSIVQISNGTTWNRAGSLATDLAMVYNDIIFSNPINFPYQVFISIS